MADGCGGGTEALDAMSLYQTTTAATTRATPPAALPTMTPTEGKTAAVVTCWEGKGDDTLVAGWSPWAASAALSKFLRATPRPSVERTALERDASEVLILVSTLTIPPRRSSASVMETMSTFAATVPAARAMATSYLPCLSAPNSALEYGMVTVKATKNLRSTGAKSTDASGDVEAHVPPDPPEHPLRA